MNSETYDLNIDLFSLSIIRGMLRDELVQIGRRATEQFRQTGKLPSRWLITNHARRVRAMRELESARLSKIERSNAF